MTPLFTVGNPVLAWSSVVDHRISLDCICLGAWRGLGHIRSIDGALGSYVPERSLQNTAPAMCHGGQNSLCFPARHPDPLLVTVASHFNYFQEWNYMGTRVSTR
jgi:hypothetical protein